MYLLYFHKLKPLVALSMQSIKPIGIAAVLAPAADWAYGEFWTGRRPVKNQR